MKDTLSRERLVKVLVYDQNTGHFTWRISRKKCTPGKFAGAMGGSGYLAIRIDYERYSAHRLAWLYVHGCWPPHEIDHIDGNKLNNAIANLRAARRWDNAANIGAPKNNTSGIKGIRKKGRRWSADFMHVGRKIHVGSFGTQEDAAEALVSIMVKLKGDFAHPIRKSN